MYLFLHNFKQKYPRLITLLPHLTLIIWFGVILLATNGQQSLMAFDEGHYATQSRWMFETGDWITPMWWGQPIYDRMIGLHWAIAACYSLFGISDGVARLPNLVTSVAATLLTYEIGFILINRRIAWLGAAVLCLCTLWLQHGRTVSQDMPLICVELLGVWALLKAEVSVKAGWKWRLLAGSTVGIGFMIKSIMVMLPIAALLPYLIWQHRRHRHLTSPALYLGLILGSIPSAVWFLLTYQHYGIAPFKELFEKLVLLGSKPYNSDGTIIYYFWNIPLNSFPWVFFAFLGMKILWSQFSLSHNHKTPISILIFYPVLLFFLLTSFSTRTPYYALQLYPFIGLLAAIALDWLAYRPYADLPRIICYLFGGLAAILLVAFTVLSSGAITISEEIRKYLLIAPILGIGWLALPFLWYQYQQEYRQYSEDQSSKSLQSKRVSVLLIVFFITPWLTLTTAGMSGLWGNYSHDVKSYLQQSEFASILQTQPINFVVPNITDSEMHVTWVLLSFYTPHLGKPINSVNELLPDSYAWISPNVPIPESAKSLGNIRNWQLIKVQK